MGRILHQDNQLGPHIHCCEIQTKETKTKEEEMSVFSKFKVHRKNEFNCAVHLQELPFVKMV